MPKPVTNVFVDSAGKSFDATEVIKGIVEIWGTEDIVTQINGPVSAEAITDNSGEIIRYRYFVMTFGQINDRKALVEQDRNGSVVGAKIVGDEVNVDVDDERSIGPDYIDNWDANKLANRINLKASKQGTYPILSKEERATRYFEAMRVAVKTAEAGNLGDGVNRIVNVTDVIFPQTEAGDIAFTKALQAGINQLKELKNSRRKGTPVAFLAVVLSPTDMTRVSNTQAFTGSNIAGQSLADGAVGKLNGVMVYESINTKTGGATQAISYVTTRGAVVVPIANPQMVEYPSKSNAWKGAFEYALPKPGSEGILYGEGIIAFGKEAEIKA